MPSVIDILQEKSFGVSRLDSELLLAHILNCPRSLLFSHPETVITKDTIGKFRAQVEKRKMGMPLAYLTNQKEFYGFNFYVDENVLIPRPETEMIIDEVRSYNYSSKTILDIGTGSGAIAIILSKFFSSAQITACDISVQALEVAEINVRELGAKNIELIESDLLSNVEGQEFDVITANLPYVALGARVEKFEPSIALFGGQDGLDLYRKLFAQMADRKIKFKLFVGEFGYDQGDKIEKELKKYFQNFEIKNDLAGIPRIFIIKN